MAAPKHISEFIHNGKREAEKNSTTEQLAYVQMYSSTEAEGSTDDSTVNSTDDTTDKSSQDPKPKHVQARRDVEIDSYLFGLVNEGLVNMQFMTWHCKVIYTLGLERYHMYVMSIRSSIEIGKTTGKPINSPAALLAYKLKGAMQLHFKQKMTREGR